jgi:hypothetical protein
MLGSRAIGNSGQHANINLTLSAPAKK